MSPPRQVGRPSFWERPSHAPPDREKPAAVPCVVIRPRPVGGVNDCCAARTGRPRQRGFVCPRPHRCCAYPAPRIATAASAKKSEPTTSGSPPQAIIAQTTDSAASKAIECLGVHSCPPFERGSDKAAPSERESMALNRFQMRPLTAGGRPSFWDRPSHALPDLENPTARVMIVGQGRLALSTVGKILTLTGMFRTNSVATTLRLPSTPPTV
jgi:hypothetical protein